MLTIAGGIVLAVLVLVCWRPLLVMALCLLPSAVAFGLALLSGATLSDAVAWAGVPFVAYAIGFFAWRRFTVSGRLAAQQEAPSFGEPPH